MEVKASDIIEACGMTPVDRPGEAATWQPGDPVAATTPRLRDGTRWIYEQPDDCCSDSDDPNALRLTLHDGGAGCYVVLHTRRWAIDSEADIQWLAARLREALAAAGQGEP